jgi:hypothetical protein
VLAESLEHTLLARYAIRGDGLHPEGASFLNSQQLWEGDGDLARERRRRSALIVRLAAELYRREHGRYPGKCGQLLGPYLHEFPEGITDDDPIPSKLD